MMETILLTGGAGFIGYHLVSSFLDSGYRVAIVDNFNVFYDPLIKRENIKNILSTTKNKNLFVLEHDICTLSAEMLQGIGIVDINAIVHLAAMAGVRPSIQDPMLYQDVNVLGTQNMLEIARQLGVKRFVLASSSSVYGVNPNVPWSESECVLEPISPYAASKIASEFLCSVYSHLYDMTCIALRLFTVYGPRQRPDLAIARFIRSVFEGEPVSLYGDGGSARDYTFVLDIVEAFRSAIEVDLHGYEVINIGGSSPVKLSELVRLIEEISDRKMNVLRAEKQPGDVPLTYADITKAERLLGYAPKVSLRDGLKLQIDSYEALRRGD